jgi:hypothetical protein
MLELARELADELGVSKTDQAVESIANRLRWYPRGNPPAIVIVKRGSDRKVLATISPKSGRFSHLYPSWEKVLTVLANEKASKGISRMSHDGLEMGDVPLAKDSNV